MFDCFIFIEYINYILNDLIDNYKTNLEKFGYENIFMDKDRIKKIFNEKYGVDHPSQVKEFYNNLYWWLL